MKKISALLFSVLFIFTSCNKEGGDEPKVINPNANLDVQDFMWKAMNLWYFWQADVPDLADNKFTTDKEYTEYLAANADPEDFFNEKLLHGEDRFSFLTDDYKELVESFAGVSKSNGLEYGLVQKTGSDDVLGYVQYIVPDSDAADKEITRGDLFTGVDGQTLTLSNYVGLLFGDNDTYTLNMADYDGGNYTSNGKSVSLTKEEGLVENPVFKTETFDINGYKIGYLMYNRFTSNFDDDLNDAFGVLKAANVEHLVLDMRYNPGGSVNSSRLLASMIHTTNTNKLYIRQRWNAKVQAAFSASDVEDYFDNETGSGAEINTLNLDKIYVLATNNSASASELVMNGLAPYVDVVHIGTTTRGKNEFSLTFVDDPDRPGAPFVYTQSRESSINTKNSWGIQPLVGRNENADGFFDYTAGFVPTIELKESLSDLGVLGDVNEPLLARAIEEITGITSKRDFTVAAPIETITSSRFFTPLKDNMYLDKPLNLNIDLE